MLRFYVGLCKYRLEAWEYEKLSWTSDGTGVKGSREDGMELRRLASEGGRAPAFENEVAESRSRSLVAGQMVLGVV